MPSHLKFVLSGIIVVVAAVFAWWQTETGQSVTPWVGLGLGLFMIFAIWLFPEAGSGRKS
jgi:hypothetical protein